MEVNMIYRKVHTPEIQPKTVKRETLIKILVFLNIASVVLLSLDLVASVIYDD